MSHIHENNVEEHHNKRVSFGGAEAQVDMIVYDEPSSEPTSYTVHLTKTTTSFTSPDAEPEKVKVTAEDSEIPRPISPPAQIERPTIAVSPPLPSLLKRMEHEGDNPFRPEEKLFHEVDPIVEAYKHRPFPPSPTSSPVPPHEGTPVNQKYHPTYSHEEVQLLPSTPNKTHVQHNETVDISRAPNDVNQQGNAGYTDLPPPGKVELVHIERKKKCGCCSIQ